LQSILDNYCKGFFHLVGRLFICIACTRLFEAVLPKKVLGDKAVKNIKTNLPLSIGLILCITAIISDRFTGVPETLNLFPLLPGLALMLWGIVLFARSPEMKNSKLWKWKLRLNGRSRNKIE